MIVYERIEPEGRCVSPDGHEWIEERTIEDRVPHAIVCPLCGKPWAILTLEDDA